MPTEAERCAASLTATHQQIQALLAEMSAAEDEATRRSFAKLALKEVQKAHALQEQLNALVVAAAGP